MRPWILLLLVGCSSSEPGTVVLEKLGLAIDMPGTNLKIADDGDGVSIRHSSKPKVFRGWLYVKVLPPSWTLAEATKPQPNQRDHRVEQIGDGTLVTYHATTSIGEHDQFHWYRTIGGKPIVCEYGTDDLAARDKLIAACKTLRAASAK